MIHLMASLCVLVLLESVLADWPRRKAEHTNTGASSSQSAVLTYEKWKRPKKGIATSCGRPGCGAGGELRPGSPAHDHV